MPHFPQNSLKTEPKQRNEYQKTAGRESEFTSPNGPHGDHPTRSHREILSHISFDVSIKNPMPDAQMLTHMTPRYHGAPKTSHSECFLRRAFLVTHSCQLVHTVFMSPWFPLSHFADLRFAYSHGAGRERSPSTCDAKPKPHNAKAVQPKLPSLICLHLSPSLKFYLSLSLSLFGAFLE